MRRTFIVLTFAACVAGVWAGPSMDSGNGHVARSVGNAGGTESTSANGRMVGSVGEEVIITTTTSGASTVRAGFSEVHAFPRAVVDLTSSGVEVTSASIRWTTPGYDGHNGTLQVGSTYYIRIASYTVPDTFADPRFANISFSTSGVNPGDQADIFVFGLSPQTTYYMRIWTTDGDSDVSYESNLSSFSTKVNPSPLAPTSGVLKTVDISSISATWAPSVGANSYVLVASSVAGLSPVWSSSSTAAGTATVSGLNSNTTYFLGVTACNPVCSSFTDIGSTVTLAAPPLSLSTTSLSSSTIGLAWSPNGNPVGTRFQVRISTDNLMFATTAAFVSDATTISLASVTLRNVTNITTYYIEVVALNDPGVVSSPSNRLTVLTPVGPVPDAPSGVSAVALLLGSRVTWNALPLSGQGVGLQFYRVSRSTNAGFGYVSVTTTTALSFVDRPLLLGPTYYYRLSARDVGQTEGPFAPTVSDFPFNIAPMEPLGLTVVPASTTVTFSWTRTTRFGDGTIFISTGSPLADELLGYAVYRATDVCSPAFVNVASLPVAATNLVDTTGGLNYFYHVQSYNSLSLSTSPVTISSLGERSYFLDDCASRVVLDDAQSEALNGSVNGVGDIRIDRRRVDSDVHDSTYQSALFRPMRDGVTEIPNYTLAKAVRVILHFDTAGGLAVSSLGPSNTVPVKHLGMYWFNGGEFKKVYGTVDPVTQTVTVQSQNLGNYQIRALVRADGPSFDGTSISGRAITPNGDGLNDVVIFTYDPGPNNETITGSIYDVMGQFVADMRPGSQQNTLIWDGRSNGRVVGGGAYIYKLSGGGKTFTGTVVVAR